MKLQEYNDKFSMLMNLSEIFGWEHEQIDVSFDKTDFILRANNKILASRITINEVNKNKSLHKCLVLNFHFMTQSNSGIKGNPVLSTIPDFDFDEFEIYSYRNVPSQSTGNLPEKDKLFNYNLEYDTSITYEKLLEVKELMDLYKSPITISVDLFSNSTYKV